MLLLATEYLVVLQNLQYSWPCNVCKWCSSIILILLMWIICNQVKEKTIAARRSDVKTLIFPAANRRDFDELADNVKEGLDVHFVDDYSQIYDIAFNYDQQNWKAMTSSSTIQTYFFPFDTTYRGKDWWFLLPGYKLWEREYIPQFSFSVVLPSSSSLLLDRILIWQDLFSVFFGGKRSIYCCFRHHSRSCIEPPLQWDAICIQ